MCDSRYIAPLRRRMLMTHTALAFVIVLGALTALVALRSTEHRSAQTRSANLQLGDLAEVRAAERELARTVRRFLLSGDRNEELRAHAIASEVEQLVSRADVGDRGALLTDIKAYNATLTNLLTLAETDPSASAGSAGTVESIASTGSAGTVERLDRFERELTRARDALDLRFEQLEAPARARRAAGPTTTALAVRAQWSIVVATLLGLLLVVIAAAQAMRLNRGKVAASDSGASAAASQPELPSAPTTLT